MATTDAVATFRRGREATERLAARVQAIADSFRAFGIDALGPIGAFMAEAESKLEQGEVPATQLRGAVQNAREVTANIELLADALDRIDFAPLLSLVGAAALVFPKN